VRIGRLSFRDHEPTARQSATAWTGSKAICR
jgi:hypothetical protein